MRTKTAHRAEELPHGWRGLFDSKLYGLWHMNLDLR